ncbi:MAG: 1-phosphofructokinase [Actinobacteria bacterium]|nr:1-phosphofructokinase [Actinomycetota bacterium]
MIVTLTPNPSIDRTVEVEAISRGAVSRATGGRVDSGGKGVNIAAALAAHGLPVTAVFPCGGSEGAQLGKLLQDEGIPSLQVPIAGPTRANISIVEPDGTVTKLNELGPRLQPAEIDALIAATSEAARGAEWVVACGSLPPGVADDFYALLVDRLSGSDTRVAVDTSGPALLKALTTSPDVVKPNLDELSEATGIEIATLGDAVEAAQALRDLGAGTVIASLGGDGALYVSGSERAHAEAPVESPRSSVGAGDALLAGFLASGGGSVEAFVTGVAWAAAAVGLPGTRMPGPDEVDASSVTLHEHVVADRVLGQAMRLEATAKSEVRGDGKGSGL